MLCPKCHSGVEQFAFGEVEIDQCTTCKGLWFGYTFYNTLQHLFRYR
ncbi:MAG: zf-TFIIB domain-containing protein [Candidatus Azotimanducaceae bacterium WSBS_2022_MAG_OTU7]